MPSARPTSASICSTSSSAPELPLYADLCRLLGVSEGHQPDAAVVNPAGVARSRVLSRNLQQPGLAHSIARRLLPEGARSRITRFLGDFNSVARPLPPETRARLARDLAPDMRRLENVLGRPRNSLWLAAPEWP
jgi:hypothetical protein